MRTFVFALGAIVASTSLSHGQYLVPEVSIAGPVTVDGDLSDWAGATWILMDKIYYGTAVTDLSGAEWAARWSDAENLVYVAIRGTDTNHVFSNTYISSTFADDVEVYLDASNSDSQTFKDNLWDKAQQFVAGASPPWITIAGNNMPAGTVAGFAASVVGSVIQYEFALRPYDTFNFFAPSSSTMVDLHGGSIIGMDVTMGTKQPDGSFAMLCENLDTAKHRDARKFKDVVLVDSTTQVDAVHHYTFNGNCEDAIGNAHATLVNNTGAASYVTTNGHTSLVLGNNGIQSNRPGEGDYVALPAGIISGLGTSGFSLEFWLTFSSAAPAENYFTFGTDYAEGEPDSAMWMTGLRNRWDDRSAFHWNIAGLGTLYYCSRTGSTDNLLVYPLNQEVQVVLTYDSIARTSRMFLHGKQFTSFTTPNPAEWPLPAALADVNNWLGRAFVDADRAFQGSFNELRIYNRPLLNSEVLARWLEGPVPSGQVEPLVIEDPVHLWKFNDPENPGLDSVGGAHAVMVNRTGSARWEQKTGPNGEQHGYWVLGNAGSEFTFPRNGPDENGDYIKLPAEVIPDIGSPNLTFELWLHLNQPVESWMWDCALLSFGQDGSRSSPPQGGATPGYHMFLYHRNMDDTANWEHRWLFGWNSGVNPWGYLDVMFARFSRPNQPLQEMQYVCTYDYTARRSEVYLNGLFVGGFSTADYYKWVDLPERWAGQNHDNWLGRGFNDTARMIAGTYNEFRIYNRVLTSKEIAARYAQGPEDLTPLQPTCGHPVVDLNKDGRVDPSDLDIFVSCAEGPGLPHVGTFQCNCADVNADGALDSADFAALQRCFNSGANPLIVNCAD